MMVNTLPEAKGSLLQVLRRELEPEDLSGFMGLSQGVFEGIVQLVEDRDPHWLVGALRDSQFDRHVRCEIAGFMRGPGAHQLILELLG